MFRRAGHPAAYLSHLFEYGFMNVRSGKFVPGYHTMTRLYESQIGAIASRVKTSLEQQIKTMGVTP
jgi:hypothetical protein